MRMLPARLRIATLLLLVALTTSLLGGLVLPGPAVAESPFRLASQIEDRAGVLGDRHEEVSAAIAELQANQRVQLWVAYVDTFSGMSALDWANQTATSSDFGLRDVLLAVAVKDRSYAYSVDYDFPLTDAQLDEVMTVAVEPALSANDWAGATVGAAKGIEQALLGVVVTTAPVQPGPAPKTGGFPLGATIAAVVVLAVVVLAVWFWVSRSRRRRTAEAPIGKTAGAAGSKAPPDMPLEELRRRASAEIVETDDAIKTSTEELGFAIAEFGEEQAAPFKQALAEAKSELDQAFALHRQYDEHADEQAQRQILTALLNHTATANEKLDAQADRFDELRDIENKAPEVLAGVERQLAALEERVPLARQQLAELASVYSPAALKAVAASPEEAALRISFAREQLAEGRELLGKGRRGEAAVAALAAQEAAGQAQVLLDAVGRLGNDLSTAQERIDAAIAETRRDIAEARAAATAEQLTNLVAAAEAAVAAATEAASPAGGHDPLASLRHLEEADAALETALVQVREDQVQRAKAAEVLDRTLLAARAEISAADDYITTHRGAIGAGPRELLAQAQELYSQALALRDADPVAAARNAASAHELARRALNEAQNEVQLRSGDLGEMFGDAASSLAGAFLGGILAGQIGGRGRGGSSGRRRGGFGGAGGARGPSFGGGGTRRGSGGRF